MDRLLLLFVIDLPAKWLLCSLPCNPVVITSKKTLFTEKDNILGQWKTCYNCKSFVTSSQLFRWLHCTQCHIWFWKLGIFQAATPCPHLLSNHNKKQQSNFTTSMMCFKITLMTAWISLFLLIHYWWFLIALISNEWIGTLVSGQIILSIYFVE